MQTIPMTLLTAALGVVLILTGFLFGQDMPQYEDLKWYEVLKHDIGARVILWVAGLAALAHAGYLQFM